MSDTLILMTTLSTKALKDLKIALKKSYGEDFGNDLTDEQFEHLGLFFLTCITETLKHEMRTENVII